MYTGHSTPPPEENLSRIDQYLYQLSRPVPIRTLALRKLLRTCPIGSYETRLRAGGVHRPNYGWCLYYAARQAKALGYSVITAVELGVAGGNGLVCLCRHREEIRKALGIEVVLVGFDAGSGMPATSDIRDVLYFWPPGLFAMDQGALEARIAGRAQLVIGNVANTVKQWTPSPDAPIGAIMFDLDYYTSTMDAFALFAKESVLPRVWCYFDDVCAGADAALTDRIGEAEAISQFNRMPERRMLDDHIAPARVFKGMEPEAWHQQIYIYHRLRHPQYNTCVHTRSESEHLRLSA